MTLDRIEMTMKQWDRIFRKQGKFFLEPQEDMPRVVDLFKQKNVKTVLDLGCGSGRHTVYLAERGFKVYGIDISPRGIKIAKSWLKQEGLKANLRMGDIYRKLPYPDGFFDAFISTQTLHHNRINIVRKLIREIERVLQPGGLLFVTVSRKRPRRDLQMPKEKVWKSKRIAPRTVIPLSGDEKGLIHYRFNRKLLRKEFGHFKMYDIWVEAKGEHYCFFAELKS